MNIRKNITRWGPTSLAVLLAASLVGPVYAQPSAEQAESTAAITDDATAGAEQVAEAQELPRGHFRLPEHGDIIGEYYTVTVEDPEETLIDIARRHNIGYEEIRMANPDVSLWVPGKGTEVVIPARYILPPAPREGVVVNLRAAPLLLPCRQSRHCGNLPCQRWPRGVCDSGRHHADHGQSQRPCLGTARLDAS